MSYGSLCSSPDLCFIELTLDIIQDLGKVSPPSLLCHRHPLATVVDEEGNACTTVHALPSSSTTVASLAGTSPRRPYCMSLIHFHTFFPPNLPHCASSALLVNQAFFAALTACRASLLTLQKWCLPLLRPLPGHFK